MRTGRSCARVLTFMRTGFYAHRQHPACWKCCQGEPWLDRDKVHYTVGDKGFLSGLFPIITRPFPQPDRHAAIELTLRQNRIEAGILRRLQQLGFDMWSECQRRAARMVLAYQPQKRSQFRGLGNGFQIHHHTAQFTADRLAGRRRGSGGQIFGCVGRWLVRRRRIRLQPLGGLCQRTATGQGNRGSLGGLLDTGYKHQVTADKQNHNHPPGCRSGCIRYGGCIVMG